MGDADSDDAGSDSKPIDDDEPMQQQTAIFSRPLGPSDMNEHQLRRMQLSDNDRAFMSRVKQQGNALIILF
jgi:hypothetical protein